MKRSVNHHPKTQNPKPKMRQRNPEKQKKKARHSERQRQRDMRKLLTMASVFLKVAGSASPFDATIVHTSPCSTWASCTKDLCRPARSRHLSVSSSSSCCCCWSMDCACSNSVRTDPLFPFSHKKIHKHRHTLPLSLSLSFPSCWSRFLSRCNCS